MENYKNSSKGTGESGKILLSILFLTTLIIVIGANDAGINIPSLLYT